MRWLFILLMGVHTWHGGALAALISFQTLTNLLSTYGYIAVVLFVMIESSGIPFPGETMLLLASFTAGADPQHHLFIPFVIACAALGAIVGDNIGYYIGRTGGRAFVLRFGKYLFLKQEHLDRAERFFAKHGDKTVFFGRFIAVLRAWAAFLAGVNSMRWRNFLIFNAAGGILWATIFGTLGYYAGRFLHDNFDQVAQIAGRISWGGAIVIVIAVVVIIITVRLRRARQSQAKTNASDGKVTTSGSGKMKQVYDTKGVPVIAGEIQQGNNGKIKAADDAKAAPTNGEMFQPVNNVKAQTSEDEKAAPESDEKSV